MRTFLCSVVTVLALAVASSSAHAAVAVVATVPDLAAITKEIGADKVNVTTLSLPTQDPHFVDAKPSLVLKLNKADLLIAVGFELEIGWLPSLQTSARNSKILAGGAGYLECAHAVKPLEVPAGPVDRSMGDIHPGGNPHYLYDPRAAASCAKAIGAKLDAIDPGNAKTYDKNLAGFLTRLDKARAGWEQRLAAARGKPVITYHKSWTYLIDWLGLVEVANLEPKPGIPPSPRHVADVLKIGRDKGVKVVIEEAYYPDKTGQLVARKLSGQVLVMPGGTDVAHGERYIQHMDHVVDALVAALK
jgi:zinc/manganese transport system substrate-binding protein